MTDTDRAEVIKCEPDWPSYDEESADVEGDGATSAADGGAVKPGPWETQTAPQQDEVVTVHQPIDKEGLHTVFGHQVFDDMNQDLNCEEGDSGTGTGLDGLPGGRGKAGIKCPVCGKVIKQPGYLKQHLSLHSGLKPHQCSLCGSRFATRRYLTEHQRLHAPVEKPHTCSQCGKSYRTAYQLKRHSVVHSDVKEFACECGSQFRYRRSLIAHMTIHVEERHWPCEACGKAFKSQKQLRWHLKIHYARIFNCTECDKSYAVQRDLRVHMLHCHSATKQFSCHCGRMFASRWGLTSHKLTHKDERQFRCHICGKSFFRADGLNRHVRNHGEKGAKPASEGRQEEKAAPASAKETEQA